VTKVGEDSCLDDIIGIKLSASYTAWSFSFILNLSFLSDDTTSQKFAAGASQLLSVPPLDPTLLKVCWQTTRMLLTQLREKFLDHAFMPRNPGFISGDSPLLISARMKQI